MMSTRARRAFVRVVRLTKRLIMSTQPHRAFVREARVTKQARLNEANQGGIYKRVLDYEPGDSIRTRSLCLT